MANELLNLIQAFSASIKCINLGIAAIMPNGKDGWVNLVSSIFLNSNIQNEMEKEQRLSEPKLKLRLSSSTQGSSFAIFLWSYPPRYLKDLLKQFENGKIQHIPLEKGVVFESELPVKIAPFSLSDLNVKQRPDFIRKSDEWKWLEAIRQNLTPDRSDLWTIADKYNGWAKTKGFQDVYAMIREKLDLKTWGKSNVDDVILGIQIPARIIDHQLNGPLLKISIKAICNIKDLYINYYHKRANPQGYLEALPSISPESVKFVSKEDGFFYETSSKSFTDLRPHDYIEVELIHEKAPIQSIDTLTIKIPIENPAEPFAKALDSFCSFKDLKSMLLNPKDLERKKFGKPEDAFETAVAWLLTLVGYNTIHLGEKHEKLSSNAKVEIGSADIIAYDENIGLLFVDASLTAPDENKIQALVRIKQHFGFLSDESQISIAPVIFSSADQAEISGSRDVRIIWRDRIESILEEAMKGNLEKARSMILW